MKQSREYPQLRVTKKAEQSILKGHPWVYNTEITDVQPFENGELVDVVSQKGSYLGTMGGVVIIYLIQSILTILNIADAGKDIVNGLVILAILFAYDRSAKMRV